MSEMPTAFSWRNLRMLQAQEVIAENLNVPLRIMRGDCIKRLGEILPAPAYSELLGLLSSPPAVGFRAEPSAVLQGALCPTDENLESRISISLWVTPRSAPNPYYEELKKMLPGLRIQLRLYLLRQLNILLSDTAGGVPMPVNFPSGLVGLLVPLMSEKSALPEEILVVGPIRLLPDSRRSVQSRASRFVDLEQEVHDIVKAWTSEASLTIEDQTNLLVLSSSYLGYSSQDLHHKADNARRVLAWIMRLEERYREQLNHLSTSEWSRAVQFVFFWLSKRSLPLLDSLMQDYNRNWIIPSPRRQFEVDMRISSSYKRRTIWIASLTGSVMRSGTTSYDSLNFGLREVADELAPDRLRFKLSDGSVGERPGDDVLSYFYHRSIEDGRANRAWQEYVSFDRLRHSLQHLRVDEIGQRQLLFTDRARELVRADVAAYLYFDALDDHLHVGSVSVAPWMDAKHMNLEHFRRWLRETANKPEERRRSAIYRCLDNRCYQSKLVVDSEGHPFASSWTSKISQVPGDRDTWGIDASDLIVVPVQFHDRILGVLYLISGTPDRFRYYDRIRLLSFVRMFEAELFEAKLFKALREMNEDLGNALRGGPGSLNQKQFCDRLMQQLGHLLAVSGAILWWRSPVNRQTLQVLGRAGRKITSVVGQGLEEDIDSFPLPAISGSAAAPVTVDVKTKELGFTRREGWSLGHSLVILLPDLEARSYLGVITLHDPKPITVTKFLAEEMRFIRDELGQNLISYMEHSARLQVNRDLIGHDVSSALKHIDGIRKRLAPFQGHLPIDRRDAFNLSLEDLSRNVRRAQLLLDVLTGESIQREMIRRGGETFSVVYQFLNEGLLQPISLHAAVAAAVHGRAVELRSRLIEIKFDGPHPPLLWVEQGAVEEVVGNLADNVLKYGAPKRPLIVEYSDDYLEFFVRFKSWGYPLRHELRRRPEAILEMGVRGVDEAIARRTPGSGKGLFVSREIAKVWDGDLSLTYEHGEPWAQFVFTLSFPRNLADKQNPWRPR